MCGCGICGCVGGRVATILLKVCHNSILLDMYHDTSPYQHIAK